MQTAFRRPLEPGEADRLVALLTGLIDDASLSYDEAVVGGNQATLLSPHFLYRPEGTGPANQPLDDYAVASRLSYFLWGSLPDDTLLARAAAGDLSSDPMVVASEARRMLADPRAVALVEDFAGQWLWLRRIVNGAPDATVYPDVTAAMRAAFEEEAERLVTEVLLGQRHMGDLLTDTSLDVSPTTRTFYGLSPVPGWQNEQLAVHARHGLLTNPGLLAALSNPTSTNPVRRGKFLLHQLLCDEPGDPPAGVVESFDPLLGPGSLRDRFAQHRADPSCASCHDKMDPLGFSLEAYGPAGERRPVDDLGFAVDATGVFPDGRTFDGPDGLGQTLSADPLYALCIAEKTFSYATGTSLDLANYPFVLDARTTFVSEGMVFEELVVAIVTSDAFLLRGEE
jgi:hypothetical protein